MADRPVGRARELSLLTTMLEGAESGIGAAVILTGDPGVGKSTVAKVAASAAAARGWRVVSVAAHELYPAVGADLLRGVANCDEDVGVELALERLELELGQRRVAAVVEDLQWCDEPSIRLVADLVRQTRHVALVVLLTTRPLTADAPPAQHDLLSALDSAAGLVMQLEPLEAGAAESLAERLLGAAPGPTLSQLLATAGGNPLAITQLVDTLRQRQALVHGAGYIDVSESSDIDATRAAIVAERLALVSPSTRAMLQAASLMGTEIRARELTVVCQMPPDAIAAAVHEAAVAGLFADADDNLAFSHALVRDSVYESIPRGVRAERHLDVARRLAEAGMVQRAVPHLQLAPPHLDDESLSWIGEIARPCVLSAPHVARDVLAAALSRASDTSAQRIALSLALAESAVAAGDGETGVSAADAVALAAQAEPDQRRQARLIHARAMVVQRAWSSDDLAALRAAIDQGGRPDEEVAELYLHLAKLTWNADQPDEMREAASSAVRIATGVDRPDIACEALSIVAGSHICAARFDDAVASA